ncbi:MAG: extracellular solute-binding protein [Thaumarchaeota archaeon]|nr:extracellular solute-binding protein [Nitrososphaerota archaeon]
MADKVTLSVAVLAILISAGSLAYSSSALSPISGQIDQARKDLASQITTQTSQVNSKISPLESSVNSVKQEQTAIRSLVDQRIGGLEKSLQDAQTRLAQAEKVAQQSQQELAALKAEQALEEAAKKEKAPLVYGNMDAPAFLGIIWPRFRESYPWAPAEPRYVEGFAPLRARFASEYQAGAPSADLVMQAATAMMGEIVQYAQPFPNMKYLSLYPDAAILPDRQQALIFASSLLPEVIAYNTNLVKDTDAPKGWLELADPKWKGKLVTQNPKVLDYGARVMADLQLVMPRDQWDRWMKGLAANELFGTASSSEAYTKVVAGEFPIGILKLNDLITQRPGTPVKTAWPTQEPIGITAAGSNAIAISKKAANPNFAKLLVQWLFSPQGQRAIAESGRPPALATLDHQVSLAKVLPPGMKVFAINSEFLKNPKSWEPIIKSYFG